MRTAGTERSSWHLQPLLAAALVVGVTVDVVARWFAVPSCRAERCLGLVASLSHRMAGAAAVTTVVMGLVAVGLSRTGQAMEEQRRVRERERRPAGVPSDALASGHIPEGGAPR